jgi:hypothetical protein
MMHFLEKKCAKLLFIISVDSWVCREVGAQGELLQAPEEALIRILSNDDLQVKYSYNLPMPIGGFVFVL